MAFKNLRDDEGEAVCSAKVHYVQESVRDLDFNKELN